MMRTAKVSLRESATIWEYSGNSNCRMSCVNTQLLRGFSPRLRQQPKDFSRFIIKHYDTHEIRDIIFVWYGESEPAGR